MNLTPGTRVGAYEVVAQIGAGGMGEVYRARDTKLGRDVALKVLPEAWCEDHDRLVRFEREASVLASLNHQNIAQIYGLERFSPTEGDGPPAGGEEARPLRQALVLEYVDGPTLADRIARGPIPLEEALPIARQIAEGLEAAHERGIIHRDLKPANIKVRDDGTVKLLDFGLAKALEPERSEADLSNSPTMTSPAVTEMGVILGTAAYMSPEQARGRRVDARSDVWAFGCVLFEMLTGRPAFGGDSVTDVLAAVVKEEPDWDALPQLLPGGVDDVLRSCLEKDPRRRLHAMADARLWLERSGTRPPATSTEARHPAGSQTALRIALAAAVLLAAVWAVYLWLAPDPPVVMRFDVRTPPGERSPEFPAFAISPDGSKYVFGTGTQDYADRLYLRELDQLASTAIPNTERASYPFFSPNGRKIAFAVWGETTIRVVDLESGEPTTPVRDAYDAGDWGSDGHIYYTRSGDRGLSRVNINSGDAEPLTYPDFNLTGTFHTSPQLLPGGAGLVLTIFNPEVGERFQIAKFSFDTGTVAPLFDGIYARYADETEHLVYVEDDGTLRAVEFDADRLEPVGDPYRLAGGIAAHFPLFGLSNDGTLLYPVPREGSARLVRVSPKGDETALPAPARQYRQVALAPGDHRVVAEIANPDEPWDDVWIVDLDGSAPRPLSIGFEHEDVAWTPDGERVFFGANPEGAMDIYQASALDVSAIAATFLKRDGEQFEPFASERHLFWREGDLGEGQARTFFAPLDALDQVKPLIGSQHSEHSPMPSPDGRWLAYVSNSTGRYEVMVRPWTGAGGGTQGDDQVSRNGGTEPRWARDSSALYYRNDAGMWRATLSADGWRTEARPLFAEGGRYRRDPSHPTYDVFEDGSFLMVRKDFADYDLALVVNFFEVLKQLAPGRE